jgi:hypothetical protein
MCHNVFHYGLRVPVPTLLSLLNQVATCSLYRSHVESASHRPGAVEADHRVIWPHNTSHRIHGSSSQLALSAATINGYRWVQAVA